MAKSGRKKQKKPVKRGFWKRFFRFWLFTFIIFIGLIILGTLIVYLFLPPQYAQELAIKTVRQQLHRELSIGSVHLNPFKGFEFTNITLTTPDSLEQPDDFPVRSASIKSAVMKYDFWQLLHGRVVVREVLLDSPQVDLNLAALPDSSVKSASADTLPPPEIPVNIELDKLRLQNATFRMQALAPAGEQSLYLSDLSLNLDDVNVPRGNLFQSDSLLAATLTFGVDKGKFEFHTSAGEDKDFSISGILDVESRAGVTTLDTLDMDLNAILSQVRLSSSALRDFPSVSLNAPVSMDMKGHFYLNEDRLYVPVLNVKVGGNTWLGLRAFINGLSNPQPYLAIAVERGNIPLDQALDLARGIVPDSLLNRVYFRNRNAAVTFTGSEIKGYLPDSLSRKGLEYMAKADFLEFGMTVDHGRMELLDLNFTARSTGRLRYSGLEQLEAFVNVSFDSLFYGLSDSLQIYSGSGKLDLHAELNERLVPEIVNMDLDVGNLVGSHMTGKIELTGTNSLHGLVGQGDFDLSNVNTENFPALPLTTTGALNIALQVNTLDTLYNRIELYTDSLYVPGVIGVESYPSLRLVNETFFKVDTTFRNITVDSMRLDVNNQLGALAHGQIMQAGNGGFSFSLDDLRLSHEQIKEWLPSRKREQYESLQLYGSTHINADLNGKLENGIPQYKLTAHMFTKDTDLNYPAQFIALRGIHADVNALVTSDSTLDTQLSLTIDSTYTDKVSGLAYLDNRISCRLQSSDLQSFNVVDGKMSLPDIKGQGDFYVNLNELNSNPEISGFLNFSQKAPTYLSVMRDMSLRGSTDLQAVVKMDTALLDIYATLKSGDLTILLPQDTRLEEINADIKVHQRMDLKKGIFLADDASAISTPSQGAIDYLTYRDYYRNSLSDISEVSIGKIQAAGYVLDNFSMEAVLGNGRIDIPTFISSIYGGNLGGRLSVNLAGGDLAAAQYNLSAHFSDINSDRLLPGLKRKETLGEINGNARFTGTGLDPNANLDIGGYFYITEIGPRVADNLLRALDPEEKDSGIKMTRVLINRGYKPKLFSFNLSHGFFSTTVELSQPWFYPLKLSGSKISLSRQPVQFFLDMAMAKPQAGYE